MPAKLKKSLFFLFALTLIVAFFARTDYKKVSRIDPAVLKDPEQTEIKDGKNIIFTKDGYSYKLTPLYDYKINALVVNTFDYTWFKIYKQDSIFPVDLCLLWGENINSKAYQNKSLSVSQDARFCFFRWQGGEPIRPEMFSNNHLLVNDKRLERRIKGIKSGDQVAVTGILVNLEANNQGQPDKYTPSNFQINSSVTRQDTGAGACEVIYVTGIEVLSKGRPLWDALFKISLAGLAVLFLLGIIDLFRYN